MAGRPAVGDLVDWAYGNDVLDENGNSDFTEARKDMGDPLHSRPATVIYGGPADDPDITLYATTNDGYLQADQCARRARNSGPSCRASCSTASRSCTTTKT